MASSTNDRAVSLADSFFNPPLLQANGTDPILAAVPAHRRATLIAQRTGDGLPVYRFDIRLQGDRETVFFEI